MTFPAYPEYKDSGVEWLGEVPADWVVGPLRWYANIQGGVAKGKSYSDDTPTVDLPYLRVANVQDGHVDLSSVNTVTVALSEVDRYRLQPGDVLMNEGGDNDKLGRGTVWQGEIADCLHQNHVFAIRPNQYLLPYWLSMFTRSGAARSYFYLYSKQSTNLASISSSNVMSCPLPLPPREEQCQVLRFLDHETARIDALVEQQQRLIALLKEKRQAVISHAVTKGLDPNLPMKDSGVEWLGKVPAHWDVVPTGYRYEIQLGRMLNETRSSGENLKPYLRVFDVQWGVINTQDLPLMDFPPSAQKAYRLEPGDLMVNEGGSYVGRSAIWRGELSECYYQKALHRLRPRLHASDTADYFLHVMEMATQKGVFVANANQTTIDHLTAEQLRRHRFAFPPLVEQQEIARYLEESTIKMEKLTEEAQGLITLLQERRSALISAAVTGKIDVRGWQPPAGLSATSEHTQTELV